MDFSVIASFLLLAVPAFFTPGPNNLMLMTSSAKFGIGPTVPHATGILLGFPLMVFAVGLGLGEIFTAYPLIQRLLKYAAAAYFVWMAYNLLGFKIADPATAGTGRARPLRAIEAALFQWVNPKAWAMAMSVSAAFVLSGEWRLTSLFLLTLGCLLLVPFSSILWMVFGRQLQGFLVRTGSERYLGMILAGLMCIAVVLFLL